MSLSSKNSELEKQIAGHEQVMKSLEGETAAKREEQERIDGETEKKKRELAILCSESVQLQSRKTELLKAIARSRQIQKDIVTDIADSVKFLDEKNQSLREVTNAIAKHSVSGTNQ